MSDRYRILAVEDDPEIAHLYRSVLAEEGYDVLVACDAREALRLLAAHPDVVLLDLMLPDVDGLVLCTTLKAQADVPIIICSATNQQRDRILGLKLGADDFIGKPFDLYELEARIEAVLRRVRQAKAARPPVEPGLIRVRNLEIDRTRRRVTLGGAALQLTPTEYRLLSALATRADAILSRPELAQQVWGYQDASQGRTIDVHMRRLRVKLAGGPVPAPAIVAVRGFGYKLVADRTTAPSSDAAVSAA